MKNIMIVIAFLLLTTGVYMATHDIGTGDNRTNAMPNTHDALTENKADGTQGITQKVNTTTGAYVKTKDAQIVVNDGANNVISIGRVTGGTYGMKVAKPGYDADTAADTQLIFNSSQNVFKIVQSDTTTVSLPSLSNAAVGVKNITSRSTIAHNLGYVPIVIGFRYGGSSTYQPLPYETNMAAVLGTTVGYTRRIDIFSDSVNIYFDATTTCYNWAATANSAPADTDTVTYYLLQETAN